MPFVYLLRCGDGSLYAGAAADLDKRVAAHRAGRGARYTRSRAPVELAWSLEVATWGEALRGEARLKALSRREKLAIVAGERAFDAPEGDAGALRLLVTDSGLGGLAVVADLERRARASGRYREVDLRFVSALPETGQGYNKMPSLARKVEVFDDALAGMLRQESADALLVACNTLSVLIPESRVLAAAGLPVVGIVELGVEAIAERLDADPAAVVATFATETTLAAGAHRAGLVERGVAPERIFEQPCPGLASRIELEGPSAAVVAEIDRFVATAAARIGARDAPVVAALCCTHYGYCAAHFAAALARAGLARAAVLDPNRRMADRFYPERATDGGRAARVEVRVVSRAVPLPEEIESTARLLAPVSPATAAALRGYELRRDLFDFRGLAG